MDNAEKKELMSVIDSGWYTESSKTKEFERMFASFVGAKYACAVTSGTAALYVGLKALNIEMGDEVIVPDLTFVASPNSVEATGAKPVLVDIEKNTLNLDLKKMSKSVSKKTKAVMPVDFNGRAPDLIELKEFAEKSNLSIIEDSCHGIGSFHAGKHTGNYSDVGIFSFSTPKIITTGQGGMLVTDNEELYEKFKMIKDFGRDIYKKHQMENAFDHIELGYNFKFTEFQAAVGIAQMKKLPERIEHNKKMFQTYRENLSSINEIEFVDMDLNSSVPWFSDILLPNEKIRQQLIEHLNKFGIGTRKFYPPIHKLPPYQNIQGSFDVSNEISERGLWLPSSSFLTDEQIYSVCQNIKNFWN